MRTLKSILLAVDFRPDNQEAVKVTKDIACAFGSRVTLLHALEPILNWPVAEHLLRKQAEEPLQKMSEMLVAAKVMVDEAAITSGHPAETIINKAHEIDADLIVVAAGERSKFDRFSLGSVAQAVVEHSPTPVLAVRSGDPPVAFRKILCPVDHSGASRRGLRNAVRLAHVFHRQLVVLTVVPEVGWLAAVAETGQLADATAQHARAWSEEFEKFLESVSFDDVEVTKDVRHGVPSREIVAAVERHGADVIVMGATGRSNLARFLLGSVTRNVLQDLPCSLLTVKEEDVVEEILAGDIRTINRLMSEGRDLLAAGDHAHAAARFRRVMVRHPFHVAAVEGLADALQGLGQPQEAELYRGRAARLRSEGLG